MPRSTPSLQPTASELDLLRLLWRIGPADETRPQGRIDDGHNG